MIIKTENIKVVTIHDDSQYWTVVQTYSNDTEVEPVYTVINENAHRFPDGPYKTTAHGLKQMFGKDITIFFDED
jgi:hypothetical protein